MIAASVQDAAVLVYWFLTTKYTKHTKGKQNRIFAGFFVYFVCFVVDQVFGGPLTPALSPPRGEGEKMCATKFIRNFAALA